MAGRTPGMSQGMSQGMRQAAAQTMSTTLKQKTRLMMTQHLRHAIKMLQVPTMQMVDELMNEVENNPLLIVGDEEFEEERLTLDAEKKEELLRSLDDVPPAEDSLIPADGSEDKEPVEPVTEAFDWESHFENGGGSISSVDLREYHRSDSEYDPLMFVGSSTNLYDHLVEQLGLLDLTDEEMAIAEYIIGNLDEAGYLRIPVQELAEGLEVDPDRVLGVLRVVQHLDPVGVAARDISECFKIQLEEQGITEGVVHDLVMDTDLLQMAAQYPSKAAEILDVSKDEVHRAMEIVRKLNPKPGLQYSDRSEPVAVPEAKIFRKGDDFVIELNHERVPEVYISRRYYDMLLKLRREGGKPEDIKFFEEKLSKALLMLKAVHIRKSTIRTILELLLKEQREFFENGIRYMKPLTRREVATKIGRDESTVSRATSNKYVDTPHGIIPFGEFFPSAVKTRDGRVLSSTYVKMCILDYVKKENPEKPLSDEEIANRLLREEGIELARRTVAKYRDELGILSSSRRRKRM